MSWKKPFYKVYKKLFQLIDGLLLGLILAFVCATQVSFSNPKGGVVVGGNAAISQQGNKVQVNQNSQKAIINWQSFNVAPNEHVNFKQPNSSSIVLNRINPQSGYSSIRGVITANGQ